MHWDSQCGRVKMKKALAEEMLVQLVWNKAELLLEAEIILKGRKDRKNPGADAEGIRAEIRKLDETKLSGYEDYKTGKVMREIVEKARKKECLHLETYDKQVMVTLIASAKVMGEDRLEVVWEYRDIYEKILGEMQ